MYKASFDDLRDAGKKACEHTKKHGFRHVVYAYIAKDDPDAIRVLDWDMIGFDSDKDFDVYVNDFHPNAEMIYAVHAR